MVDISIFVDTYVSAKDAINSIILTIAEKQVCLNISSFMLSRLLSFIIDLYNLIPLIAIAKIAGISIMFCISIDENMKIVPLLIPKDAIILEMLYPKQNPLKHIAPYKANIPTTVSPANHNNNARDRFLFIEFINNFI